MHEWSSLQFMTATMIGAIIKIIVKDIWNWKTIIAGLSLAILSFFLATIVIYFIGWDDIPEGVQAAIYGSLGFFGSELIHRIEKINLKAKISGIEITSDDKKDT